MKAKTSTISIHKMKASTVFFILFHWWNFTAVAQTTSLIYSENFNSPTHGWVIGGYNPSWSYGIPGLPNITSNGTACFATGDAGMANVEPFTSCIPFTGPTATGNYYNCCERSFVQSPTIDLTGVNSPMISLDINVHCEQTFDGSKLQLSVNGGVNWVDVGVYASSTYQTFPSNLNCREQNWYNKNTISYLSNTNGGCGAVNYAFGGSNSGWSGGCSQSGAGACTGSDNHGTNGWITSTHCIPQAANKNGVRIRIVFGCGSQVYSDGIAFDNVKIFDVYPLVDFSTSVNPACEPELTFTNLTDCAKSFEWNFGHPSSPGNTSTISDPIHIFPTAGNYSIQLIATDYCGGMATINKPVTVFPGNGPLIGSVISTSSGLCNQPLDSLIITLISAGTTPYSVTWYYLGTQFSQAGLVQNPVIISGLLPGNYYAVVVSDANNCESDFTGTVNIPLNSDGILVDAGQDATIDIGDSIQLNAISNLAVSFQWDPIGGLNDAFSSNPVANPETTTIYQVTTTSTNGCTATDQVTVVVKDDNPCDAFFVPNSFTPNGDGKNDVFNLIVDPLMKIAEYNVQIYNRWGQLVFSSENITGGWTGKDAPDGVYAFIAKISCMNKKHAYANGTISLVR
jgi:gliding motility-associated-like protein